MAADVTRLLRALDAYLKADTTLVQAVIAARIAAGTLTAGATTPGKAWLHLVTATQGAVYPLVLARPTPKGDTLGLGAYRLQTAVDYDLIAIGQTESILDLEAIAVRLDDLLHNWTYSAADLRIYSFERTHPIIDKGPEQGITYCWLGGCYKSEAGIPQLPLTP